MVDHEERTSSPPPEALLIRRHRMAAGLSAADAASATNGKVSYRRWVQVEQGYVTKSGNRVPTTASDQALAHMAAVVGAKTDQLVGAGRVEAAEVLAVILADRESDIRERDIRDGNIIRQMAEYFEDESVSVEEKKAAAERFFKILPFYMIGQRPPRDLLKDDDPRGNGGDAAKGA